MPRREDVEFFSSGVRCAAWLYRPEDDGPHPCVVMAHGFGAVRDQRLPAYAERFAAAGLAALVFDYRHFGDSGGEPRQLVSVRRQLEDWRAAIAFARGLEGIDPGVIALWGSSFSGGHVVQTAAGGESVRAVVSQLPFANGLAALRAAGPLLNLKLTLSGLRDQLRAVRGKPPFFIRATGRPGTRAAMTAPDAEPGMAAITPPQSTWRNAVAARFALTLLAYRPYSKLAGTGCPVLVQVAERDTTTPAGPVIDAARGAANARLTVFEGLAHFESYVGEPFERAVEEQTEFLVGQLRSPSAPPSRPPALPGRAG